LPSAPEVRLPPDLILTMRGTEAEREAFLQAFGAAITPYRAGRFAEAASALAPVAERYSEVVETWFYLGTARLYSGAPQEAIAPLRRARSSEVVADEARWLQVLALERAGQSNEARAELEALCTEPGNYRDRACAVVKP
jgi:Flp pilus assembly protein TadD